MDYEPATMTEKDVKRILRELQTLQGRKDLLMEAIKERHDLLKSYLHVRGMQQVDCGGWRITWKTVDVRTMDVKALAEALPELAERFTVMIQQRRFKIARTPRD